jgi:apolipoprotein N-acyltransferase
MVDIVQEPCRGLAGALARGVNELARAVIGSFEGSAHDEPIRRRSRYWRWVMSIGIPVLLLCIGALLVGAVTRVAVPPATWLAFILLLHATRTMPPASGLLGLFAALALGLGLGSRGIIPASGTAYPAIIAANALVMMVPFALDRLSLHRVDGLQFTLMFPIAFVAFEFLKSRATPAATWGSIAYTQYGYLGIMQIAAAVGIWGITFAIAWFASTIEYAWSRSFEWNAVRVPVLVCIGAIGGALLAGALRAATATSAASSIRVATLNRPVDLFAPGEMTRITEGRIRADELERVKAQLTELHQWFFDGSRREARAGARLIAWPEANLLVLREDEPAFLDRAKRVAREERVYLSMGLASIQVGASLPFENKAVLIDPSGSIVLNYLKTHAVAGWESAIMKRGDGRMPVTVTSAGRTATAICFDADFPEFIRQAGQQRADLLIVPANDWREIKTLHMQMAAFRAVENGVPMLRAAASGISSAVDPWGRVLAISDYFAPGDRTMTAQVPIGGVWTLYPRIGDLFAWGCVALTILMVASFVRAV